MLEITSPPPAPPISYPVARKHKSHSYIVVFVSQNKGIVVKSENKEYPFGYFSDNWVQANREDIWEPVNLSIRN